MISWAEAPVLDQLKYLKLLFWLIQLGAGFHLYAVQGLLSTTGRSAFILLPSKIQATACSFGPQSLGLASRKPGLTREKLNLRETEVSSGSAGLSLH